MITRCQQIQIIDIKNVKMNNNVCFNCKSNKMIYDDHDLYRLGLCVR